LAIPSAAATPPRRTDYVTAEGRLRPQSFAKALHVELKPLGVHVTVLTPGPIDTPVLAKFGLTPESMPMKPMKVEQCVSEGLKALRGNRSMIIPGQMNRIMNAITPAFITQAMIAKMFTKALANR
jgi:short-subunit dehydrogenase